MDIKQLELEEQIRDIVKADNGRIVIFEYDSELQEEPDTAPLRNLTVSTLNQDTKEISIMHRVEGKNSAIVCLQCVLNYLEIIRPHEDNYIIDYSKKGSGEQQVSYYGGNNIQEVLNKFFATRKIEEYIIHSIKMSPYGD